MMDSYLQRRFIFIIIGITGILGILSLLHKASGVEMALLIVIGLVAFGVILILYSGLKYWSSVAMDDGKPYIRLALSLLPFTIMVPLIHGYLGRRNLDIARYHAATSAIFILITIILVYLLVSRTVENARAGLERAEMERQQKERALQKSEQRYRQLIQDAPMGIIVCDNAGRILTVNTELLRILGSPSDALTKGINLLTFPRMIESGISSVVGKCLETGEKSVTEHDYTSIWGKTLCIRLHLTPLTNEGGIIIGAQGMVEDYTFRKQSEDQLKLISQTDSLTGLFNRAYFEMEMARAEREKVRDMAIVISDVDGLKLINDSLGHSMGDHILQEAATIMKTCFEERGVLSRVGGDEFAVLLMNVTLEDIAEMQTCIQKAITLRNISSPEFPVNLSVGYAIRSSADESLMTTFKAADDSMYREKLNHSGSSHSSIVQTLKKMMKERDFATDDHANRLKGLVNTIAFFIDIPESSISGLALLAQFHDIGKVGIPDNILCKAGPLSPEETIEMQRHSEIGYRIALSSPDLTPIAKWILHHHERWDGYGYPAKLKGEEIPYECRLIAIIDSYDAMISDRPYRNGMTSFQALNELRRCSGTQFDPDLVEKVIDIIREANETIEAVI